MDLLGDSSVGIKRSHLVVDVFTVEFGHLHTTIQIIQSWIRHSQRFSRKCWNTSQISLISLILQNLVLSLLNTQLLSQLANHRLKKIKLSFLFSNFLHNHFLNLFFFNPLIPPVRARISFSVQSVKNVPFVQKIMMCQVSRSVRPFTLNRVFRHGNWRLFCLFVRFVLPVCYFVIDAYEIFAVLPKVAQRIERSLDQFGLVLLEAPVAPRFFHLYHLHNKKRVNGVCLKREKAVLLLIGTSLV